MKIAFVTNTCWNVFNFREGLVKHLLDQGDEIIALAPEDEYTKKITEWGVRHIETSLDQTGTNPIRDLGYLNRIRNVFSAEQPDIALCFTIKSNIYGSLAGKISGVPTICNVSGLGTVFLVKGWLGKFAVRLYRLAFRYSSFVYFQNEDDKQLFLSYVDLDTRKIGLVPGSGVNMDRFSFRELTPGVPTKFLMISRVIVEKGVQEYAEAARILKQEKANVTFTLIGAINETHARSISRSTVEKWTREHVLTYMPHADGIPDLIANHEVIVLPSYREGTPKTLLEAAAVGRPLLSSDVPGCREVVLDGHNGFLFKAQSAQDIVDKVKLYLALSEEEKRNLGENSRRLAERKFDEKIVIECYVKTISQMISR